MKRWLGYAALATLWLMFTLTICHVVVEGMRPNEKWVVLIAFFAGSVWRIGDTNLWRAYRKANGT